jgi:hypothetical protein
MALCPKRRGVSEARSHAKLKAGRPGRETIRLPYQAEARLSAGGRWKTEDGLLKVHANEYSE